MEDDEWVWDQSDIDKLREMTAEFMRALDDLERRMDRLEAKERAIKQTTAPATGSEET